MAHVAKVLTQQGLEKINPQKGMFDTIKNISLEDIEDLKRTAMKHPKTKAENEILKKQINDLKNECVALGYAEEGVPPSTPPRCFCLSPPFPFRSSDHWKVEPVNGSNFPTIVRYS